MITLDQRINIIRCTVYRKVTMSKQVSHSCLLLENNYETIIDSRKYYDAN